MSDDMLGQILTKLAVIGQGLAEVEERLTVRINNQFERVLNRLTVVENDLHNLRSEHSVTRDLVMKLPATVLGAIEQPLLRRITAIEDRVRKLEDRGPAS